MLARAGGSLEEVLGESEVVGLLSSEVLARFGESLEVLGLGS